jgi:hypothetical protein
VTEKYASFVIVNVTGEFVDGVEPAVTLSWTHPEPGVIGSAEAGNPDAASAPTAVPASRKLRTQDIPVLPPQRFDINIALG